MKKAMLLATAAAVVLAGCETMRSMGDKMGFGPPAKIVITSNGAPACDGRTFDVNAVPDPLTFKLADHPQAFTIHWRIDTAGYSFAAAGPISDPPGQGNSPAGEINHCTAGGEAMSCVNNSKNPGTWKYTIPAMKDKDGCSVPAKDPVINND